MKQLNVSMQAFNIAQSFNLSKQLKTSPTIAHTIEYKKRLIINPMYLRINVSYIQDEQNEPKFIFIRCTYSENNSGFYTDFLGFFTFTPL